SASNTTIAMIEVVATSAKPWQLEIFFLIMVRDAGKCYIGNGESRYIYPLLEGEKRLLNLFSCSCVEPKSRASPVADFLPMEKNRAVLKVNSGRYRFLPKLVCRSAPGTVNATAGRHANGLNRQTSMRHAIASPDKGRNQFYVVLSSLHWTLAPLLI
ncbi:MAG: hypothetical protein ACO3SO_06785, partial [Luteolibacter sp.]